MKLALRNGWVVHIDEPAVTPGEQLFCSSCGSPVVAEKGDIANEHHFSHISDGCLYQPAIAIHLFAKQAISTAKVIKLPDLDVQLPAVVSSKGMTLLPALAVNKLMGTIKFDSVSVAVGEDSEFADLRCLKGSSIIYIRFATKNRLSGEGKRIVKQRAISLMEIDLINAPELNAIELQAYIAEGAPRRWISNPKLRNWVQKLIIDRESKNVRKVELQKQRLNLAGSVPEILTGQITLLSLSTVNQCSECQLLSTSAHYCSHCSSTKIRKVKSTLINKNTLPLLIRQRYKEIA